MNSRRPAGPLRAPSIVRLLFVWALLLVFLPSSVPPAYAMTAASSPITLSNAAMTPSVVNSHGGAVKITVHAVDSAANLNASAAATITQDGQNYSTVYLYNADNSSSHPVNDYSGTLTIPNSQNMGNHVYRVSQISVTDGAGNIGTLSPTNLQTTQSGDSTAPILSSGSVPSTIGSRGGTVTVKVHATDSGANEQGLRYYATATVTKDGQPYSTLYLYNSDNADGHDANDYKNTFDVPTNRDQSAHVYTFKITAQDLSNNTGILTPNLTLTQAADTNAPFLSGASVPSTIGSRGGTITVKVRATDSGANEQGLRYYATATVTKDGQSYSSLYLYNGDNTDGHDTNDYSNTFDVPTNRDKVNHVYTFTIIAQDLANNTGTLSPKPILTQSFDANVPVLSSPSVSPTQVPLSGGTVTIKVHGTDTGANEQGLRYFATATITKDGQPYSSLYLYNGDNSDGHDTNDYSNTLSIPAVSDLGHIYQVTQITVEDLTGNITTIKPTGLTINQSNGSAAPVPTIFSISPNAVAVGTPTDTTITIFGTNYVPNATVLFDTTTYTPVYDSNTQLHFVLPSAKTGTGGVHTVKVHNPTTGGGGGDSNGVPFTVTTPPSITNATLTPATLPVTGGQITVTASVMDTQTLGTVSVALLKDGTAYTSATATKNGNVYTATFPLGNNTDATAHVYTATVTATDNFGRTTTATASGSCTQANNNQPPTISGATMTPSNLPVTGGNITVTASVTDPKGRAISSVTAVLRKDGANIASVTLTKGSGSSYSGVYALGSNATPASHTFTATVTATNDLGLASSKDAIGATVQAANSGPSITNAAIGPANLPAIGGTVTISANVMAPLGVGSVTADLLKDGAAYNAGTLTARTGTLFTGTFALPANSSAAAHVYTAVVHATDMGNITAHANASGKTTQAGATPAPTVSITSPANNATFFAPATVPVTVKATPASGATIIQYELFLNGGSVGQQSTGSFSLTGLAAGTYTLTAKATDNRSVTGTSTAVQITVTAPPPAPILSSLSPNSATINTPGLTLTVSGSNFVTGSTVTFGTLTGLAPAAGSLTATQFKVAIPSSALMTPGTVQVTMFNPAPGGGPSNALPFTIVPLRPDLQVTSVTVPATTYTDSNFDVIWKDTNSGHAPATGPWQDSVYVSPDTDPAHGTKIGNFSFSGNLPVGQSATRDQVVSIPRAAVPATGSFKILVVTDAGSTIAEENETNNLGSATLSVSPLPLPDLQVTSVQVPSTATSGQTIGLTFQVTNKGAAATNASYWSDHVYLSKTQDVRGQVADLGIFSNGSYLGANQAYTTTKTVTLPTTATGALYVVVVTDANSQVTESNESNNGGASGVFQSAQGALGYLHVTDVTTNPAPPSPIFSGTNVVVNWTVKNTGQATIAQGGLGYWDDALALSPTPTYDGTHGYFLGGHNGTDRTGSLAVGDSYSHQRTITLPDEISGTWYVIAIPDTHFVAGGPFQIGESNIPRDTGSAKLIITATASDDLIVSTVSATAPAKPGQPINVSWTVTNQGGDDTPVANWTDNVSLSPTATFDKGTATLLCSVPHSGVLGSGMSYSQNALLTPPACLSGSFYIFVVTDANNGVHEYDPTRDAEANNSKSKTSPLTIAVAPVPDLVVPSVSAAGPATAGTPLTVTWIVKNQGSAAAGAGTDTVYLSQSSTLDSSARQITTFPAPGILAAGQSYAQTRTITLPTDLSGAYYVFVTADTYNQVAECTNEGNNSGKTSSTIQVVAAAPTAQTLPFLTASQVTAPVSAQSGQPIAVGWTVTNTGTKATNYGSWVDYIYLSSNTIEGQILLATIPHTGELAQGANYRGTATVFLPLKTFGAYNVIVVPSPTPNASASAPLQVLSYPLSDLKVSAVSAPTGAYSGTSQTVGWTVVNNGDGPTDADSWNDIVYLSRDQILDASDAQVGYLHHSGALAKGGSYNATALVTIPSGLSGPYYVFVFTDTDNAVLEKDETDNSGRTAQAMTVALPPPSDLVVGSVTAPAGIVPGQPATFTWTVGNQGTNPAIGQWTDSVYLSASPNFGNTATLVGSVSNTGPLANGQAYTGTLTAAVPAVDLGKYYVIVRTNIFSTTNETNLANNSNVAASQTTVDVPALTLGTPTTGIINPGEVRYYKVEVPTAQTLTAALTELTGSGNELYLRADHLPDLAHYDMVVNQGVPDAGTTTPVETLTIPETQGSTYYLMVRGNYEPQPDAPYTISARLLPFGVTRLSPTVAGNTGTVTLMLHGAKFSPGMSARLIGAGKTIPASFVQVTDTGYAYATFQVKGAPSGTYDLETSQTLYSLNNAHTGFNTAPQTSVLSQALTLTAPRKGGFVIHMIQPSIVRVGNSYPVTLTYTNQGDHDIRPPLLTLTAYNGALRYDGETMEDHPHLQVQVMALNGQMPYGTLPPGATGSITVTATPDGSEPVRITLATTLANRRPVHYTELRKALFTPLHKAAWAKFTAATGPSWRTLLGKLDAKATLYGLSGTVKNRALDLLTDVMRDTTLSASLVAAHASQADAQKMLAAKAMIPHNTVQPSELPVDTSCSALPWYDTDRLPTKDGKVDPHPIIHDWIKENPDCFSTLFSAMAGIALSSEIAFFVYPANDYLLKSLNGDASDKIEDDNSAISLQLRASSDVQQGDEELQDYLRHELQIPGSDLHDGDEDDFTIDMSEFADNYPGDVDRHILGYLPAGKFLPLDSSTIISLKLALGNCHMYAPTKLYVHVKRTGNTLSYDTYIPYVVYDHYDFNGWTIHGYNDIPSYDSPDHKGTILHNSEDGILGITHAMTASMNALQFRSMISSYKTYVTVTEHDEGYVNLPDKPNDPKTPDDPPTDDPKDTHDPDDPKDTDDPKDQDDPGDPTAPNDDDRDPGDPEDDDDPGDDDDPPKNNDPGTPSNPDNPNSPDDPNNPNTPDDPSDPNDPNDPSPPGDPNDPGDPPGDPSGPPNGPSGPNGPKGPSGPKMPGPKTGPKGGRKTTPVKPHDPNEKTGPQGVGPQHIVPASKALLYTIDFENQATATAPAHRITVVDTLEPTIDPRSFRLGEITFGDISVTIPPNRSVYQTQIDLGPAHGNLKADVSAGIDVVNHQAIWSLVAVDPATNLETQDPAIGLLPPNDSTHRGEGHVIYTVRPTSDVTTGLVVNNKATIFFDTNAPIDTNTWSNTLDADVPVSKVAALPATSLSSFPVSWSGTDGKAGMAMTYDISVSDNGGAFTPFLTGTSLTGAVFTGQPGHTYGFYSVAQSASGNSEGLKSTAEATTTVGATVTDVTSRVKVVGSGLVYSRATKLFAGTLTVTNTSSAAINGPVQVVLSNLPAGVTLANATGATGGSPYLTISSGTIAAGATVTVPVQFANTGTASIGYTARAYSGTF